MKLHKKVCNVTHFFLSVNEYGGKVSHALKHLDRKVFREIRKVNCLNWFTFLMRGSYGHLMYCAVSNKMAYTS